MDRDRSLQRALRIVTLASHLVPRPFRDDWLREWEAELAAVSTEPADIPLTRHAMGAFADAFWIRQRDVADLDAINDLRHGWRQLRQHAGFAFTAIAILSLSMAACVTAFSVVSQILLRPLPYADPDRIVTVWERSMAEPGPRDVAPGNFLDWRARSTSFQQLAAADPYSHDYTGSDRPEIWRTLKVTEGFFDIFGVKPLLGRFFRPEEHQKGREAVVVLGAPLWRSHFGADPDIVGTSIPLNGQPFVVVGVMPDDFQPHLLEDVPGQRNVFVAKAIEDYEPNIRASGYWQVVGRLKDGVSIDAAQAELDTISAQLAEHAEANKELRASVLPLREHLVGDVRPAVGLFTVAVLAVLLIACVNVTNLLLARGASRQQELAVRTALGANRARLVAQLLVEMLLLATTASVVGVVIAHAALRGLATLGPRQVLWIDALHIDGPALLFAIGLAGAVTVAAGLLPALRLSTSGLRAPGRTMTGDRAQRRLRSGLVIAEVALALMLVSGTGLLLRSFVNLIRVDTGFAQNNVIALQVFAWDRNPGPDAIRGFFDRVLTRLAAIPGVEDVGAVTAMPFIEANVDIQGTFQIVNRPAPPAGEEPRVSFNTATPGYFTTMRIPLIRGRYLERRDGPGAPLVTVISQTMADRHWRGEDPVGQRLSWRYGAQTLDAEIVGVVGSTRHESLDRAPRAELFLAHAQRPSGSMTLVARTSVNPSTLIAPAKNEIWAVDPLQTFYRTATLDELVGRTLTSRRFALVVLTGFAALALLLAAAGLYGVLSTIVSQYRREIGVRMALGADWLDILRLVVARGLAVAAMGVAVGLVGVIGASRLLRQFLFSVAPTDPWAIGGAALLMLLVAATACYIPARRAANANPVEALRFE